MSALNFLLEGGISGINSELNNDEKDYIDNCLKLLGAKIRQNAKLSGIPVKALTIFQVSRITVASDINNYYIAFVDERGDNQLDYFILSVKGYKSIQELVLELKEEFGDVIWEFVLPLANELNDEDQFVNRTATNYLKTISSKQEPIILKAHPTNKILGLSVEVFISLLIPFIGGIFYLGILIGQTKFDKEKLEYYENNKVLKAQNSTLKSRLENEAIENAALKDSLQRSKKKFRR